MLTSAVPTLPLANYLYPFLSLLLFFYKHIYKYIYIFRLLLFIYFLFVPQLLITSTELNIAANQKQQQFLSLLGHIFFGFEFSFRLFLVFPRLRCHCFTYFHTFLLPFVWFLAEGASRKIPLCHRRVCQFVASAVNII